VATASPLGGVAGVPHFPTLAAVLAAALPVDAVILCQPPQFRFQAAALALRAGKHVLLEKPPGSTTLEVEQLQRLAQLAGRTLFAAWHSRHARAVELARTWLAQRTLRSMRIEWREDVRHWHPGLAWIWEPGGLGVFDPGINGLSIATRLVGEPMRVLEGNVDIPRNRCTPIAAELSLRTLSEVPIDAVFDWRQTGPQTWSVTAQTDGGRLTLSKGGAELQIDDRLVVAGEADLTPEYASLYERFATLVRGGESEVDVTPLRLVADALLRCRSRFVEPFD
jgi:predicted dehydrogenase